MCITKMAQNIEIPNYDSEDDFFPTNIVYYWMENGVLVNGDIQDVPTGVFFSWKPFGPGYDQEWETVTGAMAIPPDDDDVAVDPVGNPIEVNPADDSSDEE